MPKHQTDRSYVPKVRHPQEITISRQLALRLLEALSLGSRMVQLANEAGSHRGGDKFTELNLEIQGML